MGRSARGSGGAGYDSPTSWPGGRPSAHTSGARTAETREPVGSASSDELPGRRMSTTAEDFSPTGPAAEPTTPASVWQAASGAGFTHDLLDWLPDVFAVTNVL